MKKNTKKGATIGAAAGGFAAGAVAGAATTAAASTADKADKMEINPQEEANTNTEETHETPAPEQAILANDEGIRYAHVDADNFNDAFAQARQQVGPGGVFEYNGRLYGTYYADEWNQMSSQEKADYQNRVIEVAPSHNATPHTASVTEATPEVIPTNAEMISAEPVDNEIRVLGVEAVQTESGDIMNIALVEAGGDQAMLIDVDNNGTIDVLIHDDNGDNQIQETEFYNVSEAGIQVNDLLQIHGAQEGTTDYISNDEMPDYFNDANSIMNV